MVEYVNIIMRNEDAQGKEHKFKTWKDALEAAIYTAENRNMSWQEAKKHCIEIWSHDTETDEMELHEVIPFIRTWKAEINLNTDTWQDFQAYPEINKIKSRTAIDAARDVLAWLDMEDITDELQFKVYPVDGEGDRIEYVKPVIFNKGELEW